MSWKIRFKPKPRCLRDKLELWVIHSKSGRFFYANLAGLIPFLAIPLGLLLGVIISFAIDQSPTTQFDHPARYVPVLLCTGVGVVIGRFVAGVIIDGYYEGNFPHEVNAAAIEKIIAESRRKSKKKRRRSINVDEDD